MSNAYKREVVFLKSAIIKPGFLVGLRQFYLG